MKKIFATAARGRAALFAGAGLAALTIATPAFAQDDNLDTAPDCPDLNDDGICDPEETLSNADTSAADSGTIVVTGSRIRRDEFSTLEPLTVVTKNEITQSGFNSSTDALQSAEVTAGAGQINNFYGGFVTAGGTGANTLGLRNLGPARTLILLNGRRLAPAGTRGNTLAADLNVLPTAIVERIEVLKAGASSIYGSDAVAGVVNIITDQQVRGLTLEAQVNVPEIGAGFERRVAATFGFGNDRLDVIGSLEYRKRDAVRLNDVEFTRCPIGGFLDGEGTEFGSGDGVGFGGNPCFTLDNGGLTVNTLGLPNRSAIGRSSGTPAIFNRFVPAPGTGGGTPGFLGVGFYDRDTFDPRSQEEELVTPAEIYTGFFSASYDLDLLGNAEVYGEVLATRRKSSSLGFRQLTLDYPRGSPLIPLPFRAQVNPTTGAPINFLGPTETTSGLPVAARAFIGFGLLDSQQEVDYVRAGGGLRGDFFVPDWRYDFYAGKSWTDGTYSTDTFLTNRLANSLNVVETAPGSGVFRCANLAEPSCVAAPPLNAATIGGNLPQNFRDYITDNVTGTTVFRETTFALGIDGPLFALPGGDVQLALGAEYRKQRINDTPPQEAVNGNLFGLTSAVPTRGSDSVKEVFGEIFVPLLADRPFFENVNINASVRYTDYESYGSDVTYKVAGEWEFFPGFGVRGSYGTSYRAPALSEQFLGATSGFLAAGTDPCDADNFPRVNGQPNPGGYSPRQQQIAANCLSIGLDVASFQQNNSVRSFTRGGAETGLEAETSTNWSVGVVLQPEISASTSLSLALDYFDIKVENGVTALGGGAIINRCFQSQDFGAGEPFCNFVSRNANNEVSVTSGFVNLATDVVKGYEFAGRFATDLFGGRFTLNANVTKYTEQSDRVFPEEILLDSNGTLNVPDWVGSFDAIYRTGPVTLRYGLAWFDSSSGTIELNATSRQTGLLDEALAQSLRDSVITEVPDYFLHTISAQFNVTDDVEFTIGVRNLLDEQPPQVSAYYTVIGNAPLSSNYDYVGRQYFVNTTFSF